MQLLYTKFVILAEIILKIMKTLLLIIGLFVCISSYNQKIQPKFSFETGLMNYSHGIHYFNSIYDEMFDKKVQSPFVSFYSDIDILFTYKRFNLNNSIINVFDKGHDIYFNPKQIEYIFNLFYSHKRIELGYKHMCNHPIVIKPMDKYTKYRASYNKLYFKVSL